MIKFHQKGFSLVEILIAMSILMALVVGGLSLRMFQTKPQQREANICRAHLQSVMDNLKRRSTVGSIRNFTPVHFTPVTINIPANFDTYKLRVAPDPTYYTAGSPVSTVPRTRDSEGIVSAQRWPPNTNFPVLGGSSTTSPTSLPAFATNSTVPRTSLNSAVLIDGVMNTLLAIYNSNVAGYCHAPPANTEYQSGLALASPDNGYPNLLPQGPLRPDGVRVLKNSRTMILIQPLDKNNPGVLPSACPNPLLISPRAGAIGHYNGIAGAPIIPKIITASATPALNPEPQLITTPTPPVALGTNNYSGIALQVTLRAEYESQNDAAGVISNCELTETFQYQDDLNPPPGPNFAVVAANESLWNGTTLGAGTSQLTACLAGAQYRADSNVKVTLAVGDVDNSTLERGNQYLCMDESRYIYSRGGYLYRDPNNFDIDATYPATVYDYFTGAAGVLASGRNVYFPEQPSLTNFPINYWVDSGVSGATTQPAVATLKWQPRWVPCDQVTLCGQPPTDVDLNYQGTPISPSRKLLMSYQVPRGCQIQMHVVSVDTAGNVSQPTTIGGGKGGIPSTPSPAGGVNAAETNEPFGSSIYFVNYLPLNAYVLPTGVPMGSTPGYYRCTTGTVFAALPTTSSTNPDGSNVPYGSQTGLTLQGSCYVQTGMTGFSCL